MKLSKCFNSFWSFLYIHSCTRKRWSVAEMIEGSFHKINEINLCNWEDNIQAELAVLCYTLLLLHCLHYSLVLLTSLLVSDGNFAYSAIKSRLTILTVCLLRAFTDRQASFATYIPAVKVWRLIRTSREYSCSNSMGYYIPEQFIRCDRDCQSSDFPAQCRCFELRHSVLLRS